MSIKNNQHGFTLVEVAIVTPFMILLALSIIAVLVTLVTSTVGPNAKSMLMQQQEKAFDSIESDINNSSTLLTSLPANFSDSASTDYSDPPVGTTVLRIQTYDQIANTSDSTGTRVMPAFKGASPCANTTALDGSNINSIVVIYYVKDNTLYRRTLTDTTNPTTCGVKLAKQSCLSGCASEDIALVRADSLEKFEVTYYSTVSGDTTTTASSAKSALVTIESNLEAAGETQSYTASFRSARLNN